MDLTSFLQQVQTRLVKTNHRNRISSDQMTTRNQILTRLKIHIACLFVYQHLSYPLTLCFIYPFSLVFTLCLGDWISFIHHHRLLLLFHIKLITVAFNSLASALLFLSFLSLIDFSITFLNPKFFCFHGFLFILLINRNNLHLSL